MYICLGASRPCLVALTLRVAAAASADPFQVRLRRTLEPSRGIRPSHTKPLYTHHNFIYHFYCNFIQHAPNGIEILSFAAICFGIRNIHIGGRIALYTNLKLEVFFERACLASMAYRCFGQDPFACRQGTEGAITLSFMGIE